VTGAWVDVSEQDIESRWRPLTPDEQSVVEQIIADAQDILETEAEDAGFAPVNIEDPADLRRARAYTRAVANMVIRVLKNPDGLLTETIDNYTYRRDSAVSAGILYVADDELARLRPSAARPRRGAFSIFPRR
jgi:hypothetical protein